MALYTPFFERSTARIADAQRRRDISEAAQSAYLGGANEMAALYGIAPEIAESMERTAIMGSEANMRRQQMAQTAERQSLSDQLAIAREQRQIQDDANAFYQQTAEEIANIDDFEAARAYAEAKLAESGFGEFFDLDQFTPEQHEQYKQVFRERDATENQRQQRIIALTERLKDSVPNPLETATAVIDGSLQVAINDATGQVQLIDEAAAVAGNPRAVIELPIAAFADEEERITPEAGNTLYELASDVGGIQGAGKGLVTQLAAQIGKEAYSEDAEAVQTIRTAFSDFVKSLLIGGRFTEAQYNLIREEADIRPSILNPGPLLQMKMRSLDRSLRLRLSQMERDAADPSLSDEARQAQSSNAANIRNLLDIMGAPQQIDISGLTTEMVDEMALTDINHFIRTSSDAELNELPEEIVDLMVERRSRGR